MDKESDDEPQSHSYDVEWYRKHHLENTRKRGRLSRLVGRVSLALDSLQGIFIGLLFSVIVFGTIGVVTVGFYLGPLVFVGIAVGLIGGLGFFVDRKVGSSLQFGDYHILKKLLAQTVALGLSMGLLLFIIFMLPKILAFHL